MMQCQHSYQLHYRDIDLGLPEPVRIRELICSHCGHNMTAPVFIKADEVILVRENNEKVERTIRYQLSPGLLFYKTKWASKDNLPYKKH